MVVNPASFMAEKSAEAIKKIYGIDAEPSSMQIQVTRKEFEGDYTLVVFPFLKQAHTSPVALGNAVGDYLKESSEYVKGYNVVKGFLNVSFTEEFWQKIFASIAADENYGVLPETGKNIMVEFSSPNTNKPLHLGHIRNNLLGDSVSKLLAANGNNVKKVTLVNDRGIHICKSMLAWLMLGKGETPETSGKKGDHLVGDYYVAFNDIYKKEVAELVAGGMSQDDAEAKAPSLLKAREMLVKWEQGDPEVRDLWKKMNAWVLKGFNETYDELGISFDETYFESETYLSGKELVLKGLEKGIFVKDPDGSIWCDLTDEGLDRKLLLRGDGTSVYMTQDIGTAEKRFSEYNLDEHVYVVGNEQNYHFQVLKLILAKLGFSWADDIFHLSYGMVELPNGKMKSREGTVVDADDLLEDMFKTAQETSEESGKLADMSEEEKKELYRMIGLGALKYFIIKVDPKKTMLFNPAESIDFNGNTGPFIQYTHARIKSILRKADDAKIEYGVNDLSAELTLSEKEGALIKMLHSYPDKVAEAGKALSPAIIANYAFDLAKEFNQYYHETPILKSEDTSLVKARLVLIQTVASVLVKAMGILGIQLPERM